MIENWEAYFRANALLVTLREAVRHKVVREELLLPAIEYIDKAIKAWLRSAPPIPDSTESITCFRCAVTSCNPYDIRHRYCGNCHAFHDDMLADAGYRS